VSRHHPSVLSLLEPSPRRACALGSSRWRRAAAADATGDTRCLHVPGAELAPPPPVRRGPGRVVAVDTPWPNGQVCHSCGRHRLVPASGCRRHRQGHLHGRYPRHVLAPRQASHYSRVRCSFPLTVIGPERGCGLSPSMTLRRPIASLINIVERSSRDSIERVIYLYFSGMHWKSFSMTLSSS
jgi:hypothetical protein